jgi:hypothetical protein
MQHASLQRRTQAIALLLLLLLMMMMMMHLCSGEQAVDAAGAVPQQMDVRAHARTGTMRSWQVVIQQLASAIGARTGLLCRTALKCASAVPW